MLMIKTWALRLLFFKIKSFFRKLLKLETVLYLSFIFTNFSEKLDDIIQQNAENKTFAIFDLQCSNDL